MNFLSLLTHKIKRKLEKNAKKKKAKADMEAFKRMRRRVIRDAVHAISPDLVVINGPFKGMKYPSAEASGSALFPKLLGSYERELHPTINYILKQDYTDIVDIGCAEGYYAIGLARHYPKARIYVFDTDQEALERCRQMAEINSVLDRVIFNSLCTPDQLEQLPLRGRSLIISDCEGYEKELFSEQILPTLAHHDLLIEIHDMIDINISAEIKQRFSSTHHLEIIESIDDIRKAKSYEYMELNGYDLSTRRLLLAEGRVNIMEWFFLEPRRRA